MSGVVAAAIAATVLAVAAAEGVAAGAEPDSNGGREGGGGRLNLTELDTAADQAAATPAALRMSNASFSYAWVTGISNVSLPGTATTTTPVPGMPESPHAVWVRVLIAVFLGVLILLTIIGNCLVCISVAIVKRLQTPSNLLIVSLAVADLLVALLVMPLGVTLEIHGAWVLGPAVCDMWTTTDVLLCTASILNLCMISVDRYLVITRPFQYAMKRTPRRMATMISIVWVVSAVVSIPPVFGWKSPHKLYNCYISLDIGYQIYATLCAFYVPLFVMIFVYVKIWLVSSKIAKAEARSQKVGSFDRGELQHLGRPSIESDRSNLQPNGSTLTVRAPNGDEDNGGGGGGDRLKNRRFTMRSLIPHRLERMSNSSNEQKATKTLGIIMGCFTLCWLPFFILALVKALCESACRVPPWLDSTLMWLGYANSFLNPVIYARFNRDFRKPFKEILCFRCRGINTRMRSESYVEQYGRADPRNSLRPPGLEATVVRYYSQGQTVVHIGNGSANSQSETRI